MTGMKQARMEQWKKINENLESESLTRKEINEAMNTLESLVECSLPKLDDHATKKIKNLRKTLKDWRELQKEYIMSKKKEKLTLSSKKRYTKSEKKRVDLRYIWILFTELTKYLERQNLLPE